MRVASLILAVAFGNVALAQTGLLLLRGRPIQEAKTAQEGVQYTFSAMLEAPSPALAGGLAGGVVRDPARFHRYLAYRSLHKFFGYDLQVEHQAHDAYRLTFRPLSISPSKVGLDDPSGWSVVLLTGYPPPQVVFSGGTIALDLFTSSATGQKIVDYVQIQELGHGVKPYVIKPGDTLYVNVLHRPEVSQALAVRPDGSIFFRFAGQIKAAGLTTPQLSTAIAGRLSKYFPSPQVDVQVVRVNTRNGATAPRNFSLEDAELRIVAPRVRLNGKPLAITSERSSAAAPVVWFYLPGHGRYVLSLLPHLNLGFAKAGEVQAGLLTFKIDGDTLELLCASDITPRYVPYNLYVFHDPEWLPQDAAVRDSFLLGSAESADQIVPLIYDPVRPLHLPRR